MLLWAWDCCDGWKETCCCCCGCGCCWTDWDCGCDWEFVIVFWDVGFWVSLLVRVWEVAAAEEEGTAAAPEEEPLG